MTLFIVRGVQGSGKTSFAEDICEFVVSADDYFVGKDGVYRFDRTRLKEAHAWCIAEVERLLKQGLTVAVANTFAKAWEFAPYLALAQKHGVRVYTVIIENRHGGKNVHGVPEEDVEKKRKQFEVKL